MPEIPDGWASMLAYVVGAMVTTLLPKLISMANAADDRLTRQNTDLFGDRATLIAEADAARQEKIEMLERVSHMYQKMLVLEGERNALIVEVARLQEEREEVTAADIAEELSDLLDRDTDEY